MFDIGFDELLLISIIGLLVLGPQRLPKVGAEIGKWVGRARRTATQLRRQLEREVELSELESQTARPPQPPPPPQRPPATPPAGGETAPVEGGVEHPIPASSSIEAAAPASVPEVAQDFSEKPPV